MADETMAQLKDLAERGEQKAIAELVARCEAAEAGG